MRRGGQTQSESERELPKRIWKLGKVDGDADGESERDSDSDSSGREMYSQFKDNVL